LDELNKTIKIEAGGDVRHIGVQDIMDLET
jgi:hypothetical protein